MPLDTTALHGETQFLISNAKLLRLHSADPGTGNSNTTTAGDQGITFVDDGNGNLTVTGVAFTGGAPNGPVTWVSIWNGNATVRYGKSQLTGDQAFNAAGQFVLDSLTIASSTV